MGDAYKDYEPPSKFQQTLEREVEKKREAERKVVRTSLPGRDVSNEEWREYEWTPPGTKDRTVYRIDKPVTVHVGESTHRVVDARGVVHCVPNVGFMGCVLRWSGPVNF